MSTRTSYRRRFAMDTKQAQKKERVVPSQCSHASRKWIHDGRHSYLVCQICGEVVKEETR